ncbi:hypothetical protein ACFQ60_10575 [Streptomyces zhihengii]
MRLSEAPGVLGSVVPALASWRRERRQRSIIDTWRYQVTWKPSPACRRPPRCPAPGSSPSPPPARRHGLHRRHGGSVTAELRRAGATVVEFAIGAQDTDPAELAARLADMAGPDLAGVLNLAALADDGLPTAETPSGVAAAVTLVRALGIADFGVPVWTATRAAVSTGRSDRLDAPSRRRSGASAGSSHWSIPVCGEG